MSTEFRKLIIYVHALPGRALSPNYSRFMHWAHRAIARKIWREAVYYAAVDVRNKTKDWQALDKAVTNLTFVFKVKRRHDADNLLAMFKAGQDSLVSAGILVDDDTEHLTIGKIKVAVNKELAPLTIIEIQEVK